MKEMVHFVTVDGKVITVNINEVVIEVNRSEKKATLRIGYKDYEISVMDAFNFTLATQKECYFFADKTPTPELTKEIFETIVKAELPSPSQACSMSEKAYGQTQRRILDLLSFTFKYLGYDPAKCDTTYVNETLQKMRAIRNQMLSDSKGRRVEVPPVPQKDESQELIPIT